MTTSNAYYWLITKRDGTTIKVPPDNVQEIQRRIDDRSAIHTSKSGTIMFHEIYSFQPTNELYGQTQLLEAEVSQTFNEPIINPDGTMAARWVKMPVTKAKWEKHYAPIGYTMLDEIENMVIVAMFKPIHQINPSKTPYCTEDEVEFLDKKRIRR